MVPRKEFSHSVFDEQTDQTLALSKGQRRSSTPKLLSYIFHPSPSKGVTLISIKRAFELIKMER